MPFGDVWHIMAGVQIRRGIQLTERLIVKSNTFLVGGCVDALSLEIEFIVLTLGIGEC